MEASLVNSKLVERICPICKQLKTFPTRNQTCSYDCGYKYKSLRHKETSAPVAVTGVPLENTEADETAGDSRTITLPRTRLRTLEELVKAFEIDLQVWEVERFVCNKWEVGAKDANDQIVVEPLYQVKAWLKRRVKVILARDEIRAMVADAKQHSPAYGPVRYKPIPSHAHNLLELSLPDLHFGKLAWGAETGWESYDSKIARETFETALATLLERTKGHRIERVAFVMGNDLFNADSRMNATTAGTPQDVDGRHQKTFVEVRRTMIAAIDGLRQIAPVSVLVVAGNHDQETTFYLGDSLECWYAKDKHVTVDNSPTSRKYLHYGQVLLMFSHGDKEKRSDYPMLMASECKQVWSDTTWREIHTGDKHAVRLEEKYGIRVRILPSLCPPDAWHAGKGFVGNVRAAEAYVWNKQDGLIGTAHYSIHPPKLEIKNTA